MFVTGAIEQLGGGGQITLLVEGGNLLVLMQVVAPELVQLLNGSRIIRLQLHGSQFFHLSFQNGLIALQARGIFLDLFRSVFFQHA